MTIPMRGLGAESSEIVTAKIKSADQSNGTTVFANDSELQIPIAANESWILDFVLAMTCSNAGDLKITVTAPSGADGLLTSTVVTASTAQSGSFPLGTSLGYVPGTSATLYVNVTVTNGATAGTVNLQFAQGVSDPTPTKILKGSSLVAFRPS